MKRTIITFCLILWVAVVQSAFAQDIDKHLMDYDFAVNELENSYAGFQSYTTGAKLSQYEILRDSLRIKVSKGEQHGYDAAAELFAWFGDFHLRCGGHTAKYMKRTSQSYDEMEEYSPQSIATKVNDQTFLIRFPSCAGDNPTLDWVKESVQKYLASGCSNLIIDIRGNGGGLDTYYLPYRELLYDKPGIIDGVELINSETNRAFIKEAATQMEWLKAIYDNMEEHKDSTFVPLTHREVALTYDSISPLPLKAAIIIDGNVGSSGEQMLLDLRSCSSRTKFYGRDNTLGCLDFSNARNANLPYSNITMYIPMSRSCRLPDRGIDQTGIAPDVRINLPLPTKLTDNIDEWVFWVAQEME